MNPVGVPQAQPRKPAPAVAAVVEVVVDDGGEPPPAGDSDGEPPEGEPPGARGPNGGGEPARPGTARPGLVLQGHAPATQAAGRWLAGLDLCGDPPGGVLNRCTDLRPYTPGFYVTLLADAIGRPVQPSLADLAGVRRPLRRPRGEDIGLLIEPYSPTAPSDRASIQAFMEAGERAGRRVELLQASEPERLRGLCALLVRATTSAVGPVAELVRRADALGVAILEPPEVLVRCCNKAWQAARFAAWGVPTPRTLLVQAGDAALVERALGYPCVLKLPDSSGGEHVRRAEDRPALERLLAEFTAASAVVVAQAWTPSEFDWRIGLLDGELLFASRYNMAPGHWQVHRWEDGRMVVAGPDKAVPLGDVPPEVLSAALRAAAAVGGGLVGVDVKEVQGRALVMEVNDTPTIFRHDEDAIIGQALYDRTIAALLRRVGHRVERPRRLCA